MRDRKIKTGIKIKKKKKKGKERSLRLDKGHMYIFWRRVVISREYEKKGQVILIGWRRGNTALMAQAVDEDGEKRSEVRLISTRSSAKRNSLHG